MFKHTLRSLAITVSLLTALAAAALLTGCALETTAVSTPDSIPIPGVAITGTVHGGSQPIFGAKVYLLAVNPTGYAGPGLAASSSNASVSLLNPASTGNAADAIGSYVLTDSQVGSFSLSSRYSCTAGYAQGTATAVTLTGSEQVYLYILGGRPQNATSANTSSGMLVALGACNAPTLQVAVNEITTTATAYALAGFATDATHIGSSGSSAALTGLGNAFANLANLAVVSSGTATANTTSTAGPNNPYYPTTNTPAITRPAANLISIADILAACVNGTTNNANCQTLFKYTESSGATGTAPTDTATAAINLAHNPYPSSAGMTALFALIPGTGAPFAGGLSSQPNDFTLGLRMNPSTTYANGPYDQGGVQGQLNSIAIDSTGNAWVTDQANGDVYEFSSNGNSVTSVDAVYANYGPGIIFNGPGDVAIDTSGNVWVTISSGGFIDANGNSSSAPQVIELVPSQTYNGSMSYSGGGLNDPDGIAIDYSSNAWVANNGTNNGTTISEFSSAGKPSSSSGYTGGGLSGPISVAIDASGNVWTANNKNGTLSEFNSSGTALSPSTGTYPGYSSGCLYQPWGIAIDASGNAWSTNANNNLCVFNSSGQGTHTYTGGGLNHPHGVAIDGSGTVWTANYAGNSVSAFTSAGVALSNGNGYTGGGYNVPQSIAVDASGNVWVPNLNDGTLTELIGAATPVLTPLSADIFLARVRGGTGTVINRP